MAEKELVRVYGPEGQIWEVPPRYVDKQGQLKEEYLTKEGELKTGRSFRRARRKERRRRRRGRIRDFFGGGGGSQERHEEMMRQAAETYQDYRPAIAEARMQGLRQLSTLFEPYNRLMSRMYGSEFATNWGPALQNPLASAGVFVNPIFQGGGGAAPPQAAPPVPPDPVIGEYQPPIVPRQTFRPSGPVGASPFQPQQVPGMTLPGLGEPIDGESFFRRRSY